METLGGAVGTQRGRGREIWNWENNIFFVCLFLLFLLLVIIIISFFIKGDIWGGYHPLYLNWLNIWQLGSYVDTMSMGVSHWPERARQLEVLVDWQSGWLEGKKKKKKDKPYWCALVDVFMIQFLASCDLEATAYWTESQRHHGRVFIKPSVIK